MKKTLALVLALAMVFSSITVAFAEDTLGEDAQTCADLGMLKGEGGTVDAAYTATAPTRLQAAVMFLRLKGLEAEALAFTGEDNFADGEIAWAEGANLIAYLKANPQLGWIGDGTSFNPEGVMTAQAYYKVMLEALGYKQTTDEVAGDFAWTEVLTFAASVGLSKVAEVENFTVNDLAIATVEALKVNVKDTEKTLADTLVEAGVIDEAAAVAAGLVEEVPTTVGVAIDDVYATGNAVVVVEFEEDVDPAAAGNIANYAIEGLEINAVTVADTDKVVLDTAAMSTGKLYTLTVGESSMKFAGVAKVSGAPEIDKVVSEDVEEVVITFTKNIDQATGTDVANYSIAGVEIAKAEVDEDEVTLTTVGLKNKTKYTVRVTNIKSVDGATKKSTSDTFTSKFDVAAPKVSKVDPETNQRLKVTFNEKVTKESAEDLANYEIKVDEKDGGTLDVVSVEWDSDDENFVYVVTEPQERNEDYKISVNGIVDQRKAGNTMTRPDSEKFKGVKEDETAPKVDSVRVLSPTSILVSFKDDSRIDEASATDINNYDLDGLYIEEIRVQEDAYQIFRVILVVEEMEDGESYSLRINDIEDEFGNTMDKEDKTTVRATSSNVAAVAVKSVVARGENTVYVEFSDEVDEASAENISNYNIDEGVGAPRKAEYDEFDLNKNGKIENDEKYLVKLTTNDIVNGWANEYDLVVDGVLDLAGNELYHKGKVTVDTVFWDKTAPELEDGDAIDENVVSLTFDEKVRLNALRAASPNDAVKLILSVNDTEPKAYANQVELVAKDIIDDDTVVEFCYYKADGTLLALPENVTYSVYKVVYYDGSSFVDGGITDYAGNPVVVGDVMNADISFEGTAEEHEAVEMDSYSQIDAKTFELVFPRKVVITNSTASTSLGVFDVEYESAGVTEDDKIRLVKKVDYIEEDKDYIFNFKDFLADKLGFTVANDEDLPDATPTAIHRTELTGEYDDEDEPYVDDVVARDRKWIKVVFNERIVETPIAPSDFELKNYDLDKGITIDKVEPDTLNDGIIYLRVVKPLEARYEYSLELKGNIKDFRGLTAEKDTYYFDGTNVAPYGAAKWTTP
jgi:hypothetical protein